MSLSAHILAGGRSSRMGADKASLVLDGRTLLDRALDLARSITPDVCIITKDDDLYPGHGPLAGIHAALSATSTDLNLILAVDTPFLTPDLLRFLLREAERTNAIVTVPKIDGRFHPLCAVYHKDFAAVAARSLTAGHNKIDPLFAQVATRIITEEDLKALDFRPDMFDNLNTPEDFRRAQERQ